MQNRFLTRRQALGLALGSALGLEPAWAAPAVSPAPAANWPDQKPIKVIVPHAPGGLASNMMRAYLADRVGPELETKMKVQSQPGTDGMAALARAAPDGYTLAFADTVLLTLAPLLGKTPYDPARDFAPIASVCAWPVLLMATPALARRDIPDFPALLARARAAPGIIRCATAGGPAALGRLILEQIKTAAGVDIAHVPYPADGPLVADALAGKFDLLVMPSEPGLIRQIKAAQLRPLAVSAPARIKEQLPRVPTLAELGLPSANLSPVLGFFAPAGTPPDIVEKLNRAINTQSRDAEVRHHIDAIGLVAINGSAADFSRVIAGTTGNLRAALNAKR
jgi:tripartite-type tricarboxylate transporter receptor subunit TctC